MSHKAKEKPTQTGKNAGQFTTKKDRHKKEGFMSSNQYNSISQLLEDYLDAGIGVLVPLPAGEKQPPLGPTGGAAPQQTVDEARHNFDHVEDNCNVALRLNDSVLILDIDDHGGDKQGASVLAELEKDHGKLPDTAYNTRHGADSGSRHLIFKVPAGIKWIGKISGGIDLLQFSHRYAVVEPSVVEGKAYHWYDRDGKKLDKPPHMDELPELPSAWVEFLKKGALADHAKYAPKENFATEEAVAWLRSVATNTDAEPTEGTRKKLNQFLEDIDNNAHDTSVDAVHWAVRYTAVDGAAGLNVMLKELKDKFVEVRSTRPTAEPAADEWGRLFADEVNALRGEIEAGKVTPLVVRYGDDEDFKKAITSLLGASTAETKHDNRVEKFRYLIKDDDDETAVGEMLLDLVPTALGVLSENSDTEIFDEEERSYLKDEDLKEILREVLKPILKMCYYQIPPEVDDEEREYLEGLNKQIGGFVRFVNATRNLKAIRLNFVVSLNSRGRNIHRDQIDAQPELLGLPDGRVIDLSLATAESSLMDVIRERKQGEMITKSLSIDPEKATAALAHRREFYKGKDSQAPAELFLELALPNPEVRRVAQKLLGYAAFGRMESRFRNIPVFMGPSSSGKTVLTNLIKSVAGDYAGQVGIEALSKPDDGPNAELAKVIHSRWLFVPELSSANKAASARLKAIASSEGVTATFKHSNDPIHSETLTPIIVTNDAPDMRIDDAILKRLVVVPMTASPELLTGKLPKPAPGEYFRRDVYGKEVDQDFHRDDESKAFMLEWLIQGFLLMRAEGIDQSTMPAEIQTAIADFVGEADPVAAWMDSLDFSDKSVKTSRGELERSFANENPDTNFPSGPALKKMLEQRGAEYKRVGGRAVYVGVKASKVEDTDDNPGTGLKVPMKTVDKKHLQSVK